MGAPSPRSGLIAVAAVTEKWPHLGTRKGAPTAGGNRRPGLATTHGVRARHDQLTNAALAAPVRCPPIHRQTKKAPGVPGLKVSNRETPRGNSRRPDVIPRHKSGKARVAIYAA